MYCFSNIEENLYQHLSDLGISPFFHQCLKIEITKQLKDHFSIETHSIINKRFAIRPENLESKMKIKQSVYLGEGFPVNI